MQRCLLIMYTVLPFPPLTFCLFFQLSRSALISELVSITSFEFINQIEIEILPLLKEIVRARIYALSSSPSLHVHFFFVSTCYTFFSFPFHFFFLINRHGNVPFLLWVTGLFIVCMCASGFQRCNDICSANCQRFVSSAGK